MTKGAAQTAPVRVSLVGPLCAVIGILGFSFKAILIKLALRPHRGPVELSDPPRGLDEHCQD